MSRQGNLKKLQHGVDVGRLYDDRKHVQIDDITFNEENKSKSCKTGNLLVQQSSDGRRKNGVAWLSSSSETSTTKEMIMKSERCLFKVKKQPKNIQESQRISVEEEVNTSVHGEDDDKNKMDRTESVNDIKISMVNGNHLEHFMDSDNIGKATADDEADNAEPKFYIAVPSLDNWNFDGSQLEVPQLEQSSGNEKDRAECSPMHLTFTGSGQEVMLMTPQELERMPESGIEFEESVGPKESPSSASDENGFIETNGGSAGGSDGDSGTLATISISTDAATNTTSIVINTEKGQKAFQINTADLMQAAATLQPITLADLVKEHAGDILNDIKTCNVQEEVAGAKCITKTLSLPSAECIQDDKSGSGLVCAHTGRCKKAWTCPDCGKFFNKHCKLKVHMLMHAGCRPFKCTFEGCDWTFTSVYKLNRHQESHCNVKDFKCDFEGCDRSFTTIYNLNSHKKNHAQRNEYSCPIENCNLHFQTKRKMQLHLKEHEGVEAPYKCSVESCGKTYYTANSMASHLRVHKSNRLQCNFEGCDKVFDRLSRFKTHVWKHTGERPYKCQYNGCEWKFSSASKLKRHMRKHTGERQYPCNEPGCGKSFMRLEHLQGHAVTHSGDKPFHCPHQNCDAKFTAKSSLYVHLKKHRMNVEKVSHLCPIQTCGKRYNCKSSLQSHMQKYHKKECISEDGSLMGGITLIAADEDESHTIVSDHFQQQGLVTVTVSQSDDGNSVLTDGVEASEFMLTTDVGAVVNVNDMEPDLIYSPVSSNLVLASQCSSESTEVILPSPIASSDLNQMEMYSVLQTNNSGSARTDYCCNRLVTNRNRQRRRQQQQLQQQKRAQNEINGESLNEARLSSNDVVLSSTAFRSSVSDPTSMLYIPNPLLPDDAPPSHGELYQEDGLLNSMAKDLAVPISLLTEQTGDHGDFTGTTINLQDLE
ncbi:hypothetical protein CHUAL_001147 [Chamberlinius hualienensis]